MPQVKLTNWENEPTVEDLQKDFRLSQSYHTAQMSKIHHWRVVLNEPEKLINFPNRRDRSRVQPKMAKKQAIWRYSALSEPFLNSPDLFSVEPRTFEDREAAFQNETLLNYQFDNQLDKVGFINKLIHRVVDDGTAIVKVGWDSAERTVITEEPEFEISPVPMEREDIVMSLQQQLTPLVQLKQANPRMFNEQVPPEYKKCIELYEQTGQLYFVRQTGTRQVEKTIFDKNQPTITVMRPENVYIDPTSEGIQEDLNFVIYTFRASRAYLQSSGLYTNLDQVHWENGYSFGDYVPAQGEGTYPPGSDDDARRKVVVYEWWGYYDIHDTGELVPVVASWIGDTMIRLSESPFPDRKLPFIFIAYLPIVDSIYGEPDAVLLEDPQAITGAVYRGIIDLLARSANSQQGMAKNMLDTINRARFYNGEDYEFNPDTNPNGGGLIMHTYPEIPVSALNFLQMQNYEAESLTGTKAFSGGISGDAYGRVVTAANYAHDAAANVEMDILRRIAKGISLIGSKIIAMNAVFLSDEEVIRITNQQNQTNKQFLAVHPEDLKGNFDCRVDIKTAKAVEDQVSKLTMLMQTVGPNTDFGILKIAMVQMARMMNMPDMAEAIRNYEPQPDPELERNKQLINEKLESEVIETQTKAALNQAKATSETTGQQLDYSQAVSEQAKAMLDSAKARRETLEINEEVSGVNHQRAMELMQAQADAQGWQAIEKGMMNPVKEGHKAPDIDAAVGLQLAKDRLKEASDRNFREKDAENAAREAVRGY